jgi:hypothetical protein
MQKTLMPSKSSGDKIGTQSVLAKTAPSRPFCQPRTIILTIAVLWSSLLQLSTSNSQSKQPILIDSIFTQPDKLQLRFRPMGHYAASTFTSHVRIPFYYSSLLQPQDKMIEHMDHCIPDLDDFNFNLDQYNRATLNSTFEYTNLTSVKSSNCSTTFLQAFLTFWNVSNDNGTSPHLSQPLRRSRCPHTTRCKFSN